MSERLTQPTQAEHIEASQQLDESMSMLKDFNVRPISSGHYGNPEGDVLVSSSGESIKLNTDGKQDVIRKSDEVAYTGVRGENSRLWPSFRNVKVERPGGVVKELTGNRAERANMILKQRAARQLGQHAVKVGEVKLQKAWDTMAEREKAA